MIRRLLVLVFLALPPFIASRFDAPSWAVIASAAPFFAYAMRLGSPEETMFGDATPTVRRVTLTAVLVGGTVLAVVAYALWSVLVPAP